MVGAMDWSTALSDIHAVPGSNTRRSDKAVKIAEVIRQAGSYRWVGLYEVTEQEIAAIGWSGPGAPVYPRLPVTQGLSGAAVAARKAVVVDDVTADPRYLTAFPARSQRPSSRCSSPGRVRWEPWMWKAVTGTPSPMPIAKPWSGLPPPRGSCSPRPPLPPEVSTPTRVAPRIPPLSLRPTLRLAVCRL
jgi:hypothetical protein